MAATVSVTANDPDVSVFSARVEANRPTPVDGDAVPGLSLLTAQGGLFDAARHPGDVLLLKFFNVT